MFPSGMHALIALQQADGHWELTAELANLLERKLSDIERELHSAAGDQSDHRRAWATALAIAWLELRAAGARDEWRLLAIKGRKWIDRFGSVSQQGQPWGAAAERFLTSDAG